MDTPTYRFAMATATILALCCAPSPAASASGSVGLDRTIKDDRVVESSGLARSTHRKRLLWTHNDKGGQPRLFAVGGKGRTRAVLTLSGAEAVDWEDVASGPRHKLWVGDIGDNEARRDHVSVYRIREPKSLDRSDVTATRFDFTYPGGARDAEGLMVNPRNGRLFIVSKDRDGGAIYRAPKRLHTDRVNELERLAAAPPNVTGAAFAPGRAYFALCSYSKIYLYSAFNASPRRIDKPDLHQGESLAVSSNGRALFVGSEGRKSPVYRVPRR